MLVPLDEVLSLPAVATGSPQVVVGEPGTCLIRWVHSSEVFEMGPLLHGGELLLTTGLGLRGVSASQLEAYVEALADAGLAALALELGRTFAEVPEAMLRAAQRRNLPLVAFREVVPFEEVVEAFHELVLDREIATLRVADRIWRELVDTVLAGDGLLALVQKTADLARAEAYLFARDGRLVAASKRASEAPTRTATNSRPIEVLRTPWGTLVLDGRRSQLHTAVLDRAVRALGLELARAGTVQDAVALTSTLLRDLVEDRLPSVGELRSRCELAGFPAEPGRPVVGLAVAGDRRIPPGLLASSALRSCRGSFGACIVGHLEDDVLLVARAPRGGDRQLREQLARMCAAVSDGVERATGHAIITVAAGSPVDDVDGLAKTITQAREVASIARRLGTRRQALLARDLGIYRLLSHLGNEAGLTDFMREQIGPLLDHDAAHSSELVTTLDTFLQHGLAKTDTATALGIRRQTLYNRLDRINAVLGHEALAGHESRTALGLALHAWRLRTGLDPGRQRH
jgi:purine catabolism regulator